MENTIIDLGASISLLQIELEQALSDTADVEEEFEEFVAELPWSPENPGQGKGVPGPVGKGKPWSFLEYSSTYINYFQKFQW